MVYIESTIKSLVKQTNKQTTFYFFIVNLQLQVVGYIIHLMAMKRLLVLGKPNRASNPYKLNIINIFGNTVFHKEKKNSLDIFEIDL